MRFVLLLNLVVGLFLVAACDDEDSAAANRIGQALAGPVELEDTTIAKIEEGMRGFFAPLNEINSVGCECGPQRGGYETTAECLSKETYSMEEMEQAQSCVIEKAATIESGPPQGIDSYLKCRISPLDDLGVCAAGIREYHEELCSEDSFEYLADCHSMVRDVLRLDYKACDEEVDDEVTKWLQEALSGECLSAINVVLP